MQKIESEKQENVLVAGKISTLNKESGMQETKEQRPSNRTPVVSSASRFAVSTEQYESVKEAHRTSIDLLDSCGNALLDAMQMALPPKDSGRTVGDYTGANLRQMAKSVCDIVQTKTGVVRSMYAISRDE